MNLAIVDLLKLEPKTTFMLWAGLDPLEEEDSLH